MKLLFQKRTLNDLVLETVRLTENWKVLCLVPCPWSQPVKLMKKKIWLHSHGISWPIKEIVPLRFN